MDPKAIYRASQHHEAKAQWLRSNGTEWVYCGIGPEFKADLAQATINRHFECQRLFVVLNRHIAYETQKSTAARDVALVLNDIDALCARQVSLWSDDFRAAIIFSDMGVMKAGWIETPECK